MKRNFIIALASLAGALTAQAAATGYVAWHDWFGLGDLYPYLYWNALFSVYLFAIGNTLRGRLVLVHPRFRVSLWLLVGALAGFSWTWIVAATLQGWILAFSFPVLYIWSFAGVVFGLLMGWIRSPDQRRVPARPWVVVLVPVIALIAVPLITIGGMLGSRYVWNRPQPEVFTFPYGFVGQAYLVFDSEVGQEVSIADGALQYQFDESGVLVVRSEPQSGWTNHRYLYRAEGGKEIPIIAEWHSTIEDSPENRSDPTVGIYFVHAGNHQRGDCSIKYRSFSVGTRMDIIERRGVDMLETYIAERCGVEGERD